MKKHGYVPTLRNNGSFRQKCATLWHSRINIDRAPYREGGPLHRRCHYVTKSTEIAIAIMSSAIARTTIMSSPYTYKGHGQKPKVESAIMSSKQSKVQLCPQHEWGHNGTLLVMANEKTGNGKQDTGNLGTFSFYILHFS